MIKYIFNERECRMYNLRVNSIGLYARNVSLTGGGRHSKPSNCPVLDGRVIDRTIILPTNNPYYTDRVIYPLKNNSVIDFCVSYSGAKPIPVEGFKHEVYLGYNPDSPLQPEFKKYLDNTLSLFGLESFLWIRPPFFQKGGSRVVKVEDYETEARKYIDN